MSNPKNAGVHVAPPPRWSVKAYFTCDGFSNDMFNALTARACFLSYVHPVHYNVVTDVVRGDGDPRSPIL